MSDPYTREFVGEDQDFSPEVYENIRAKETELDAEINDDIKTAETIESEERQVDLSPDTPSRAKQQQQQPKQTEEVESSEEKPSEDLGQRLQDNVGKLFGMAQEAGKAAQPLGELANAPAVGSIDFVRDSLNLIPHVNIPKVRKFESEYAQASRELSSFLLPSLFLGAGGKALGVAAASKYPVATKLPKFLGGKEWVAGRDALVKLFGRTGVELGTGVFVDYANAYSSEGNNFTGTVREMFPSTQRWISTDIATLSSDSPDVKRDKSVREGVGLGLASAFLEAAGAVARGIEGTVRQTRFIAGPDSMQSLIDDLNEAAKKSNIPETEFSKAAASMEEARDEVGAYMLAIKRGSNLDEPVPGIHTDAFTPYESGSRTVDPNGIHQAALDAVKIANNEGTVWGRLANPVSEPARKFGLDAENLTKRAVVKMLAKQVADGGRWSAELDGTGRFVSYEEHNAMGERLYEILADPRMEPGMMKELLDNFKSSIDDFGKKKQVIGNVAYNAVMKAMKFYLEEFADMNVNKATAYFSTANAGQISDMAEGARLMEGTEAVSKAQEMILDRLEYLMVEKGLASYNAGKTLNLMNMWKRFSNDPEKQAAIGMNAMHDTEEAFRNIVARSKNSVASLRFMAKERPSFLKPLQMMWEMSDGNIDTLAKMHTFVNNSLPMLNKGFIDLQPEIPNVILTGMKSTLYNSVLSAFATPIKAGTANAVLTAIKPLSVFAGAMTDVRTLKRAAYQYSNLGDHIAKGMRHMGFVFKKASLDPTSVNYMLREDMAAKNEATMNALYAFANSAQKEGNDGPMILYNLAEQINDIANHPVLRFGGNAMASLDGFVRAFMGNVEVKGNIYDRMVNVPGSVPAKDVLRKAEKEHYDALFDKHGMITDSAVDFASREIAFNLDTEGSKSLSSLVKAYPVLGNILLFPRTGDNAIGMAFKFAPVTAFSKDIDKLFGPSKNFTREQMAEALQSRGIKVDEYIDVKFRNLRAEIRGRKAIAAMAGLAGAVMFSQDRLRGDGHFDKERQRARVKAGWEARTFMGNDGRWYSYEFLGPLADIIAFQANVMDNHDTLDPMDMATLYNKSTHVLGASLFSKAMFAPLEPMFDMLGGNFSAATRFAGTMTSALFPMSGQRAEMSRIIVGGMSELNDSLLDAIHNRNKVIDVVDPKIALPKAYDWVDQRRIGYSENFFTRLYNGLGLPFAAADGISPERQFLLDIEYDGQPTFSKSTKGVEYTPTERSELFEIMGRDGLFRKRLRQIMKDYDADKFRAEVKRQQSIDSNVSRELFAGLYDRIDDALEEAKKEAEAQLSNASEISVLERQQQINKFDQQEGKTPTFPLLNR